MSSDEMSSDDEQHKDEEIDYTKVREELSNMSFEELLLLKEKLGTKSYNEAMFPSAQKAKESKDKDKTFKRENKNRPSEVSSKKPVSKLWNVIQVKKKVNRDPRFDDLSGTYNETYFKQAYGFLSDVKENEKKKLKKMLAKEIDPEKKLKLRKLLKGMAQREKAEQEKEEKKQKERELRDKERKLVAAGKKPYFLKKSEKKKMETAAKEEELKKSGKLDKYLKRKEKKALKKDRKKFNFEI